MSSERRSAGEEALYSIEQLPKYKSAHPQIQSVDNELLTYSELLDATLIFIKEYKQDDEMLARAELKNRFRISDDSINTALFKRHGESKVQRVTAQHHSVVLADVRQLEYLMDGWIPKGDISLVYGSYGTGKTTLALWKAYHYAQGKNILDRTAECIPGKSLFIATDSGAAALKKSAADIGIDTDIDPLFQPGPQQMIWTWAYAPEQGHNAWICDINGVLRLEQFIEAEGISYIVIDSAKSVSSAAGWSYTSNEAVKALLKHLREGVCTPLGACIEFLSHDGTEKGSHSGAKAWAEDPSMVCRLEVARNPEGKPEGVTVEFRKDRASNVDPRRKLTYDLTDEQFNLKADIERVGTCEDGLLKILWEAHLNGVVMVTKNEIADEAFNRFRHSFKTVENTLPKITGSGKGAKAKPVIRKARGKYALAPHEIQAREAALYRDQNIWGGVSSKILGTTEEFKPPIKPPVGGTEGLTPQFKNL